MKNDRVKISVVTPAYRCRECISELHRRLSVVLSGLTDHYEIIFVDDGSPDGDWEVIRDLALRDAKVKGIKLSRNFGQHYAITAGLDHAAGLWVVVMDCDLQDQPEEIPKLYGKAQEGYDIVLARRQERNDSLYRRLVSWLFVQLYNHLGDIKVEYSISNFSIASRQAVDYVRRFRERDRSIQILLSHVGFRHARVNVQRAARFAGESAYTFSKLLDFAIQCIVSQSNKPLRLSIRFGFLLCFLALLLGSLFVVQYFYFGVPVPGWTSLAVLTSFLGGLGFANLGILGLYLGKVFDEVKNRPLYCVEQTCNFETTTSSNTTT